MQCEPEILREQRDMDHTHPIDWSGQGNAERLKKMREGPLSSWDYKHWGRDLLRSGVLLVRPGRSCFLSITPTRSHPSATPFLPPCTPLLLGIDAYMH